MGTLLSYRQKAEDKLTVCALGAASFHEELVSACRES